MTQGEQDRVKVALVPFKPFKLTLPCKYNHHIWGIHLLLKEMWGKSSRPLRPCSHLIDFTWFYYLMALLVLVSQQHHVTACLSADVGVWLLQLDIVMGAPWPLQLRVSFQHLFCPSVVQIWSATSSVCNRNFSDSYLMLANVWHPVQWHLKSTKIYTGFTFYFKDNCFELHFCFFFFTFAVTSCPTGEHSYNNASSNWVFL